jgi:ABC-2 type transport system permease protein
VVRNLKIRYKGSALGFFWSLMDPLFMALIYFIFAKLTRFQIDIAYLISGVFVWQFLSLCVGDSFHAVVGNTSLVKKVYFPRLILPLSTGMANFINFLLSFGVLVVFLLVLGVRFDIVRWVYLPGLILIQFVLCLGLALLCAGLMVYFRDTQHFVMVALMAWFFMSPVMYPIELVPEELLNYYLLNPMSTILMGFRYCLLGQPFIWSLSSSISFLICVFILILGIYIFLKLEPYFADEL